MATKGDTWRLEVAPKDGPYGHIPCVWFRGYDEGPTRIGRTALHHHVSAFTGDHFYGYCDACGWSGREVRTPDSARRAMTKHAAKCKGTE